MFFMCYISRMNEKNENTELKTAVITGASSGIGKVVARKLTDYGYKVVCVSRTRPDIGGVDFYECDLSNNDTTVEAAKSIAEKYGKIDLVINNAGLGISGATELLPMESVRYVMEVDYFAPLSFTRELIPFIPRGGKIVMISSACALFALPYRGVYCSAKAALNMLSFGLRMELKDSGISVVSICPGDIRTEFTKNRIKYTDTNDRYGESVLASQEKVDGRENKRMNAEKAGAKIAKIAATKKGALYVIGAKYKLLYFLSKIFPQSLMLKATKSMFVKRTL